MAIERGTKFAGVSNPSSGLYRLHLMDSVLTSVYRAIERLMQIESGY